MTSHVKQPVQPAEPQLLGDWATQAKQYAIGSAVLGILGSLILGKLAGDNFAGFYHSYLVSFCFFLSISLGALFFVALQHLTRAGWSVSIRRVAEYLSAVCLPLGSLFLIVLIPVVMGSSSLYHWNDPKAVEHDELLQGKQAYLNSTFFAIRAVGYFVIWGILSRFFLYNSLKQDESGDKQLTLKMQKMSAPAMALFALSVTFASVDWLMSLEPHWFSTIFGVYFFAGAIVAFFSTLIICIVLLQKFNKLSEVNEEHIHDIAKLLFGFIMFWGYIAFSQYLLIWYGDIPEETQWYLVRQNVTWSPVSGVLLFGQFFIPFLGMMSRQVRRNKNLLLYWSIFLLVMHWIDLYWLVMPQFSPEKLPFSLIDISTFVGVGGFFIFNLLNLASNRSLLAIKDPRLQESLTFENN